MITMSFGFQNPNTGLRRQIEEAAYHGKIVFAAASNDGGNSRRTFPASHPRVICIHSTDHNGNKSQFNPSPMDSQYNFSILGQNIKSCWPNSEEAAASRRMSGTSFATAVAAALAACCIGYVELTIKDWVPPVPLRSHEGITRLFGLLAQSNTKRDGYDLIAPFLFFRKSSWEGEIKYTFSQ